MWKRTRRFIKRRFLAKSSSQENQLPLWLLLSFSVALAYSGFVLTHGQHLWQLDYFQFFPVFLAGIGVLTWQRLRNVASPPDRVWRIAPVSMALSIIAMPVAVWMTSPKVAALSLFLLGNSLLCSYRQARRSWRLLAILIPLPLGYDRWLVHKLQQVSSQNASVLLDTIGVPHLMRGNILQLADRQLFVEEACSGISSIYLMLATTCFCLVWYNTRAVRAIPLVLSVFWWAIVANILRIVTIAAAHYHWQTDLSTGMLHELTGIAVLCFSFGMVYLTMQFLDFLSAPIGDGTVIRSDNNVSLELTPTVLWNLLTVSDMKVAHGVRQSLPLGINVHRKLLLYSLSIFLLFVGTAHLGLAHAPSLFDHRTAETESAVADDTRDAEALATFDSSQFLSIAELSEAEIQEEEQSVAARSRTWNITTTDGGQRITLVGPQSAWQDPRHDYEHSGWQVVNSETTTLGIAATANALRLYLIDKKGNTATLHCGQFQNGTGILAIPDSEQNEDVLKPLRDRLKISTDRQAVFRLDVLTMHAKDGLPVPMQKTEEQFQQLLRVVMNHWRRPE